MIPTYNEADNIAPLWQLFSEYKLNYNFLFVNDVGTDNTGSILDELALKEGNVFVLHRKGKQGIGTAHQAGIKWAYDNKVKVLITMDSDLTHSPHDVPKCINALKECDVVVGSRYMEKNSLAGWSLHRKFLTWLAHTLTNILLGLKYDATGAFRAYKLDVIPHELFEKVISKSYSFFFESLHVINFNEFRIKEIAIKLPPRTYGHSKMSFKDAFRSLKLLFTLWIRTYFLTKSIRIDEKVLEGQNG
jgi:dolichol-phosphate mannosyltransferase